MNITLTKICVAFFLIATLSILWYVSNENTKDDNIDSKIHYLHKNMGYPYANFILSPDLKSFILSRNFDPVSLRFLVISIMKYLKFDINPMNIIIHYNEESNLFNFENHKRFIHHSDNSYELHIVMTPYYSIDHLISVISHDCISYYLFCKNIQLQSELDNNILIDIATIYLGFGDFIIKSYNSLDRILNNNWIHNKLIMEDKVSIIPSLTLTQINYILIRVSELKLKNIIMGNKQSPSL